jgi:hypothetical protein
MNKSIRHKNIFRLNKDYIAIYPQTLFDMSMEEMINSLMKKYPSVTICVDENDRYFDPGEKAYIETVN